MLICRRNFITFLAIVGVAINCIAPQIAFAAHHPDAAEVQIALDYGSRGDASHDHRSIVSSKLDNGAPDTNTGYVAEDQTKYCCATTCTVSAYILAAPLPLVAPAAAGMAATPLDDALRAFNTAAIDPPPRAV